MWILPLIGYLGLLFGFAFLTLAIASGLYYLSELVEEHTVLAKKLLTRLIYTIIAFHILLVAIDRFPLALSGLSIVSHAIYGLNLRRFPIVRLSDPIFLSSCILVLLNHWLWFRHFSSTPHSFPPRSPLSSVYTPPPVLPSFTEIASYFFIMVWLVPFALFVSLSAGENVLPSMGSEYATDPTSPLASPASTAGGMLSPSGLASMGAMLSPRSLSRGGGGTGSVPGSPAPGSRSSSSIRGKSLGYDDSRRGRGRSGAKGLVRVAVDGVREYVSETGEAFGLWRGSKTRKW